MNSSLQQIGRAQIKNDVTRLADEVEVPDKTIETWAKQYGRTHLDHFASVIEAVQGIDRHATLSDVLEIGAVPGYLTALLASCSYSVAAVDLDPDRMRPVFDRIGVPCHRVDVEAQPLPFPEASFDLVLFCEILEHLRYDPLHAMREVTRVLRPGGSVVVSSPQITPVMRWRFLWGRDFQGDIVTEFEKLRSIGHMGHFRLYSERDVRRMLDHAALKFVSATPGGKLSRQRGLDARLFRCLAPKRMRAQIYVCARK